MADQIYSMCWPAPSGSSQYQSDSEQHTLQHPRLPATSGNVDTFLFVLAGIYLRALKIFARHHSQMQNVPCGISMMCTV
jgi:hypothetical protein